MRSPRTRRLSKNNLNEQLPLCADLTLPEIRHANLTRMARLEHEVAALPDPWTPTPSEIARRASEAQLDDLLNDWTKPRELERGD